MATSAQLKSSIKQIESAMKNKALQKTSLAKFQTQLDRLKGELASLNSPKPKKGITKAKVMTSLQKLKATIKADKALGGYKNPLPNGKKIDIEKDADIPALKRGVRTSKGLKGNQYGTAAENKGRKYYEYRLNRADVKQPPKKYPKLEDGGMMEDEGLFAKGGHMAKGGMIEEGDYVFVKPEKLNAEVVRITGENVVVEFNNRRPEGGNKRGNYKIKDLKKVSGGGYMAMGGIIEHGLEVGDNIYDSDNENNLIFVENDGVDYEVNLDTGKRYRMGHSNERQDNYMAKGGKLYVKSYADDKREKALHRGKRISDEGNVYYENRLDHADVDRRRRLEHGGEMHRLEDSI
jgi:hypothetical protein